MEEQMSSKKKKTRRSLQKYPALDPAYNLKTRAELLEVDYLEKLSDKEKEWLNKFNEEYVNGKLDRTKRSKNLHRTKKLIKDCDDRNNARNRDIYTIEKAKGLLQDIKSEAYNPENDIITSLDKKKLKR